MAMVLACDWSWEEGGVSATTYEEGLDVQDTARRNRAASDSFDVSGSVTNKRKKITTKLTSGPRVAATRREEKGARQPGRGGLRTAGPASCDSREKSWARGC
jgi:hypothetical protein